MVANQKIRVERLEAAGPGIPDEMVRVELSPKVKSLIEQVTGKPCEPMMMPPLKMTPAVKALIERVSNKNAQSANSPEKAL